MKPAETKSAQASVLVGLLWCVALLSLVVISLLHTAVMDLMVVKNYGDKIQAHYLALAGIEKAKALLYQEARERSRTARNHSGELYSAADQFRQVPFGRGRFSVLRRARPDEGDGIIFGVTDEESRLNVNTATAEQLTRLEGLLPTTAAAILAWRGENSPENPAAGYADYYLSLAPPYQPRNGPFQTVRELLLVRGVTPEQLLGDDRLDNGLLADLGTGTEASDSTEARTAEGEPGWAGYLTVDSTDRNVNAAGQARVNIQTTDEAALTGVRGITPPIARAIVQYRGQNRFESIADLLDVTAAQSQNQTGSRRGAANAPGPQLDAGSGPKVIGPDLLMDIGDEVTADSNAEQAGLINLNTASQAVLACLPNVDRELAQAIISYRQSAGFFPNIAWLLKVPGIDAQLFKQLAPRVTARSETFRILSEGTVRSTGARERIQVIVHIGLNDIKTLSYREDDL